MAGRLWPYLGGFGRVGIGTRRKQLGDHLDKRVALFGGVADECSGAQTLTLKVGDNIADGSGVLADDHDTDVAQDPDSGAEKRPY